MVGSRYPAGIFPGHAGTAHENVLYGIIEHVPHVQHTGNVGGGYNDCVGFATIGFRFEVAVFQPIFVPLAFDVGRVVLCCNIQRLAVLRIIVAKNNLRCDRFPGIDRVQT